MSALLSPAPVGLPPTPAQLDLLRWWAEGERPHRFEWLDATGGGLADFNLRSPSLKSRLPKAVPEGADMVRLTKQSGRGLATRRWGAEDWPALAPYFTGGLVNITGLALVAAPKPERRRRAG